jgi:hypothetical protein
VLSANSLHVIITLGNIYKQTCKLLHGYIGHIVELMIESVAFRLKIRLGHKIG